MNKKSKIYITSKNLILKTFKVKDINDEYIESLNDKNLMKFSQLSQFTHDRKTCIEYILNTEKSGKLLLGMFLKTNPNLHIGNITISFVSLKKTADLSVFLIKKYHNKGYAVEAFNKLINHIFQHFKSQKVTVGTCSQNYPMIKLAQKVGMKKDSIKKKFFLLNNVHHDVFYYSISNINNLIK